MMRFILFLTSVLVLTSYQAQGTVTISQVSGASHINLEKRIVYGGTAGDFANCPQADIDAGIPCNNCSGLAVCNRKRVYDTLLLKLTISSDSSSVSGATVKIFFDSQEVNIPSPISGINTNDTVTVEVPWGNICSAILGASCDGNSTEGFNKTLTVGLSNDNSSTLHDSATFQVFLQPANVTAQDDAFQDPNDCQYGFCSFQVFPGDQKVYLIDNSQDFTSKTFPNTRYQPVGFTALRLFYAEGNDFNNVTASSSFKDFDLIDYDNDKVLFDISYVDGLKNDTQYVFRAANLDSARNVTHFSPLSYLNTNDHSATPNPVYGLLDDNTNCFIASATFGSKWAPEVDTFREFRNRFLHPYPLGQKLTRLYYKHSPFWAAKIQSNPLLKTLSLLLLWPLWFIVSALLKGGVFSLAFITLGLVILLTRRLHKKRYGLSLIFVFAFVSLFSESSMAAKKEKKRIPKYGDGYELIRHPNAKKGLKRITQKGTHLYHVETSSNDASGSFKFGFTDIPKISSSLSGLDLEFTDIYGKGPINTFYGDYEWRNLLATFGLKVGTGLSVSSGHGRIKNNSGQTVASQEKLQLFIIPLDVGINWRWSLFRGQWLVPYFYGGFSTILLLETRDDKKLADSKAAYSLAQVAAGGLAFRLDRLDPHSIFKLDQDYGINSLSLVAEYRIQVGLLKELDFTTNSMNIGLSVDF